LTSNVAALGAGASHTCAVFAGGTAQCWGANGSGQLGNGTVSTSSSTPVPVSGLTGATGIVGGGAYTCAILATRGARCWGNNPHDQLGNDQKTSSALPVSVLGLTAAGLIGSGGGHSCAIEPATDTAKCWGANADGEVGDGTTNL